MSNTQSRIFCRLVLCLALALIFLGNFKYTHFGTITQGDDVVGLTRGFMFAGTTTIVASLWKVSDDATSILMQKFYQNLATTDKREALRLAQLYVKENVNAHPFFWAAFQMSGGL